MTAERLIAGRYRLSDPIGTGAMGVVWKATDVRLQRTVAVKQLRLDPALTPSQRVEARARAMREGRIAARLHHPNAITVFDVAEEDGRPWLVMEFMDAPSLAARITGGRTLPPAEVARIGAQAAAALAAAHDAGILHRDVKPANLLVGDDGTVKITDFGISRAVGDVTVTATGFLAGTPAYLAPEVARGENGEPASDVFALGSTLYAAVTGHPPFGEGDNPLAVLHAVARGHVDPPRHAGALGPVLMHLLAPTPGARPTMREAKTALEAVAAGRTPGAALLPPGGHPRTAVLAGPGGTTVLPEPGPTPPPSAFRSGYGPGYGTRPPGYASGPPSARPGTPVPGPGYPGTPPPRDRPAGTGPAVPPAGGRPGASAPGTGGALGGGDLAGSRSGTRSAAPASGTVDDGSRSAAAGPAAAGTGVAGPAAAGTSVAGPAAADPDAAGTDAAGTGLGGTGGGGSAAGGTEDRPDAPGGPADGGRPGPERDPQSSSPGDIDLRGTGAADAAAVGVAAAAASASDPADPPAGTADPADAAVAQEPEAIARGESATASAQSPGDAPLTSPSPDAATTADDRGSATPVPGDGATTAEAGLTGPSSPEDATTAYDRASTTPAPGDEATTAYAGGSAGSSPDNDVTTAYDRGQATSSQGEATTAYAGYSPPDPATTRFPGAPDPRALGANPAYTPPPQRRDPAAGKRLQLAALAAITVAVVVLAGVLIGLVARGGGAEQAAPPPSASPSAEPAPAPAEPPAAAPTSAAVPPPTSHAAAPQEGPPTPEQMAQFVQGYYGRLPGDINGAWAQLSPGYQAQTGGFGAYSQFWSTIRGVRVGAVNPTGPDTVVADLTYTLSGGSTSSENRWFRVTNEGGRLVISGSGV